MVTALLSSLPAAAAIAQVPDSVRIPITDPALIARLAPSFPPETKLYMLPGALESTRPASADDPRQAPHWFGGVDFGATTLSGNEFDPIGTAEVDKNLSSVRFVGITGSPRFAVATLHLDTGVRWDGVLWWALDNSAQTLSLNLIEVCHPFAAGGPTVTLLASGSTTGSSGNEWRFTGIPSPVTIQNGLCSYLLSLQVTGVDANFIVFERARAGWFRQVSPAPAMASFDDVPTTHPFFPFIEALYAAGITGGCGNDNFCPDQPLTRGQMAVFLSVALGLHWPF
jgi:hypothetical protein